MEKKNVAVGLLIKELFLQTKYHIIPFCKATKRQLNKFRTRDTEHGSQLFPPSDFKQTGRKKKKEKRTALRKKKKKDPLPYFLDKYRINKI